MLSSEPWSRLHEVPGVVFQAWEPQAPASSAAQGNHPSRFSRAMASSSFRVVSNAIEERSSRCSFSVS